MILIEFQTNSSYVSPINWWQKENRINNPQKHIPENWKFETKQIIIKTSVHFPSDTRLVLAILRNVSRHGSTACAKVLLSWTPSKIGCLQSRCTSRPTLSLSDTFIYHCLHICMSFWCLLCYTIVFVSVCMYVCALTTEIQEMFSYRRHSHRV